MGICLWSDRPTILVFHSLASSSVRSVCNFIFVLRSLAVRLLQSLGNKGVRLSIMSRRGYGFERETELWCCKIAEQDVSGDFASRSFRTATSGAATSSKGDVRLLNVPWMKPITFECKHLNDYSKFGPTFHLYVDWLNKVEEEAAGNKAVPMLTWAFKHARTHRGEGRVQFVVPEDELISLTRQAFLSINLPTDSVKYVKNKAEYYLVYHDELWKSAGTEKVPVGFVLQQGNLRRKWVIISRRHLEMILVGIREKWKSENK